MKNFSEMYNTETLVNEGWNPFEKFWGKSSTPKTQDDSKKGLFAKFGAFLHIAGLEDKETKSETEKALEAVYKAKQQNNEKRQAELRKAKDKTRAEKIKAKFELRNRQLDLANARKVNAFNSVQSKLQKEKEFFKSTDNVYSEDEILAYEESIDADVKALEGTTDYDKAEKLSDLIKMTCIDEDGNPRNLEQIKEELSKNKKLNDALTAAAKENGKEIKDSMADSDFLIKSMEEISKTSADLSTAEKDKKDFDHEYTDYQNKVNSAQAYKKAQTDYANLDTEIKNADDEVTKAEKDAVTKGGLFYRIEGEGEDAKFTEEKLSDEEIKTNIKKLLDPDNIKDMKVEGKTPKEYVSQALKAKHVPQSVIDKVSEKLDTYDENADPNQIDLSDIASNLEIKAEDIKKCRETAKKEIDKQRNAAKAKKELAEAKKSSAVNPEEDDQFKDIRETLKNDNPELYDPESEAGKQWAKEMENTKKKIDENYENAQTARNTLKDKRKMSADRYDAQEGDSSIPTELKSLVQKREKDFNDGEFVDPETGKISCYMMVKDPKTGEVDKVAIERPGIHASQEERDKYEKERKNSLLLINSEDLGSENSKISKIEKDGDNYKALDKDGNVIGTYNKEEMVKRLADRNVQTITKANAKQKKQEFLDAMKAAYDSTGDTGEHTEAYDNLDKETKELIKKIHENPKAYEKTFSDLQIDGKSLKDYLKNEIDWSDDTKDIEDDDEELRKGEDLEAEDGDEGAEETTDETGNKKKIIRNPAKIWKRRPLKNGKGSTTNYYKVGAKSEKERSESKSPKEYKEMVDNYKKKLKKKNESLISNNKNLLFESYLRQSINKDNHKERSELYISLKSKLE